MELNLIVAIWAFAFMTAFAAWVFARHFRCWMWSRDVRFQFRSLALHRSTIKIMKRQVQEMEANRPSDKHPKKVKIYETDLPLKRRMLDEKTWAYSDSQKRLEDLLEKGPP